MDTYSDGLFQLFDHLGPNNAITVGRLRGGGKVARLVGRYGTSRLSKTVFISSVPPLMVKTAVNSGGLPIDVFDRFRASMLKDQKRFISNIPSGPFFGSNREDA